LLERRTIEPRLKLKKQPEKIELNLKAFYLGWDMVTLEKLFKGAIELVVAHRKLIFHQAELSYSTPHHQTTVSLFLFNDLLVFGKPHGSQYTLLFQKSLKDAGIKFFPKDDSKIEFQEVDVMILIGFETKTQRDSCFDLISKIVNRFQRVTSTKYISLSLGRSSIRPVDPEDS